jgi:chromosome segregation ATPase
MSTRRLEMSVDQLKAKTTNQLSELAKKTQAITKLKQELGEKNAAIQALEAREKNFRDQIRATEQEYEVKTTALREAERALNDKQAELTKVTAIENKNVDAAPSDSERIEIVALRTQIEAMRAQLDRSAKDVSQTGDRLGRERENAQAASQELTEARANAQEMGSRAGDLEKQLIVQTTEAELQGRRVQELEARLTEQGRMTVEREYETNKLREDIDRTRQSEAALRAELAAIESRHRSATDSLRGEKTTVEQQLSKVTEERAELQREVNALRRDAESNWASERVENALLRERINDIAAEVSRLTMTLEGPDSPIETMLAGETNGMSHSNGSATNGNHHINGGGGNLADRIRALQSRSSRVAPLA